MPHKAEETAKDLSHSWVGPAIVALTVQRARRAMKYGSVRTGENEKVEILEVYCEGCRRNYDDVADEPCQAKINNDHLIGGDPTTRAKRKKGHIPENATVQLVPGLRVNRRGIDAFIRGEI